jgi:hypothetical protein
MPTVRSAFPILTEAELIPAWTVFVIVPATVSRVSARSC